MTPFTGYWFEPCRTVNSLFDGAPPVADLPPAPLPTKVTKRIKRDGKFIDVAVLRKAK